MREKIGGLASVWRRLSRWALLLIGSATLLVVAGVVFGALWLSTGRTAAVSSCLPSSLLGIELRVQSGDVASVGGSQAGVSVRREDRSVFGHGPRERKSISSGILRISSTYPQLVIGVGAADAASGSGLRGLSDRVDALDGELTIDSPAGGGTRVTATIPSDAPA